MHNAARPGAALNRRRTSSPGVREPADDIVPRIGLDDFTGVQPYKIVMVGEKSSLEPVLGPIAAEHGADLYLPTGEISDTQIYLMAKVGAADPRPTVVLYFSDCDPAGWQAPFFDATLGLRVLQAKSDWLDEAQAIVDNASDQDHLDRLAAEAETKLAELREQIAGINDALRLDVSAFDLPPIEVPEAEPSGPYPVALVDSKWSFAEQCRALIDSKAYRDGGAP